MHETIKLITKCLDVRFPTTFSYLRNRSNSNSVEQTGLVVTYIFSVKLHLLPLNQLLNECSERKTPAVQPDGRRSCLFLFGEIKTELN